METSNSELLTLKLYFLQSRTKTNKLFFEKDFIDHFNLLHRNHPQHYFSKKYMAYLRLANLKSWEGNGFSSHPESEKRKIPAPI